MSDRGPHSIECATADGGVCHCDCHGTMHGIGHVAGELGGKHHPSVTVTPLGHGRGYQVIDKRTGLPPGGGTHAERLAHRSGEVTVTATSRRPHTLTPATAHKARTVRDSLPKTREDWAALVPQAHEDRVRYGNMVAHYEAKVAGHDQARQDAINAAYQKMRRRGWKKAEVVEMANNTRSGSYWSDRAFEPLRNLDGEHMQDRNALQMYRDMLAKVDDSDRSKLAPVYPTDPATGRAMPTAEQHKHLAAVLDVGHSALADMHEAFGRDDQLAELRAKADKVVADRLASDAETDQAWRDLSSGALTPAQYSERTSAILAKRKAIGRTADVEREIRRREADIVREILGQHRTFGGLHHTTTKTYPTDMAARSDLVGDAGAQATRTDWRERLDLAEQHFPQDWLRHSTARELRLVSAARAYYSSGNNALAMSTPARDTAAYLGGFRDETDEVTVHEMGHRMEHTVPGLRALEFALVRKRSTRADGTLEQPRKLSDLNNGGGYDDHEVAFEDRWTRAYAGKTYEGSGAHGVDPADTSWEAFQVGLQDVFGRSDVRYGDDELQAFVVGALLTLA